MAHWRSGQVIGLADQVAFIVGLSTYGPGTWDCRWIDCIGETITLPYDDASLRANGNLPGVDRVGVPGVERIARNPLQWISPEHEWTHRTLLVGTMCPVAYCRLMGISH
jgi:hypothetical protein